MKKSIFGRKSLIRHCEKNYYEESNKFTKKLMHSRIRQELKRIIKKEFY